MGGNTNMSLISRVVDNIKSNRDRVLGGLINCIPIPFPRFRQEFPGIQQKTYYLVSGATKAGKTQITNYLFVYNTLLYAYNNPGKITPKIFYYNLEEDEEDITLRFMSFLLYTLSGIEVNPMDLSSIDERKPLSQSIIDKLESAEYKSILNYYEEHVKFMPSRNPTGMWKDMTNYANFHGKTLYEDYTYRDDFGRLQTGKKIIGYEPIDPNEYVIIIADHVSLWEKERGMTLKETIDKYSEYCITLRNRYKYIPVAVQQQNIETIGLEAFKADKIRPTMAGLADSKNTGKDCTVMIGITNPHGAGKDNSLGYDITKFKGALRLLEIVLNRKGQSNSICPLYFNGAVNYYKELPLPTDSNAITKVYNFINNKNNKRISLISFSNLFKLFKK